MFKAGDKVKVIRHRAFAGNDVSVSSGLVGKVITLGRQDTTLTGHGFDTFLAGDRWLIRSDDIELVAADNSPIRTVTRREIVPGSYGIVEINDGTVRMAVYLDDDSASDLRAAATLFNELADVLDENQREAA